MVVLQWPNRQQASRGSGEAGGELSQTKASIFAVVTVSAWP
jgi:hypothetical protein